MSLNIPRPPPQVALGVMHDITLPASDQPATSHKSLCYWESTWNRLRCMQSTVELCDLSLQSFDGAMFYAHSAVLAASSEVYYTYCMRHNGFENHHNGTILPLDQKEDGRIIVPQLSGTALKVTLNFVYGMIPEAEADFTLLLQGGEVLGIPGAVACARQHMKGNLQILQKADFLKADNQCTAVPPKVGPTEGLMNEDCHTFTNMNRQQELEDIINSTEQRHGSGLTVKPVPESDQVEGERSNDLYTTTQSSQIDIEQLICPFAHYGNQDATAFNGNENHTNSVEYLRMVSTYATPTTPSITASVKQHTPMNDNYKQTSDWIAENQKMYQQQTQLTSSFNADHQKFTQNPQTITQNGFPKSPIKFNPSPVGRMNVQYDGAYDLPVGHDVSINSYLLFPPNNFVPSPVRSPYSGDLPINECNPLRYSTQPISSGKNIPFSCSSPIFPRSPQPMNQNPNQVPASHYQDSTMQTTSAMTHPNAENNNCSAFFNNTQQIVYNINGPTVDVQVPSRTNYTAMHGGGEFNNASQQLQSPKLPGNISSNDDLVQDIYSNVSANGSLNGNCSLKQPRYLDEANVTVNADIIARMKLPRKQDNICLADSCGYNNKCVDYMESHKNRKHDLGEPEKLCDHDMNLVSKSQLNYHTKRGPSEPVECPDCHQIFPTAQKQQIHMLKVHSKGRLYTCADCNFRSPRKKDVQSHIVSQHNKIPPGVQVYICPHCEYKCTDKTRAKEHQAMHLGQPTFVCHICNKSYTSRRGMASHVRYHSKDRPHICDLCTASFKVKSKLREHIKLMHTNMGEKPYECGYCGHKTTLRGNCKQHIRRQHPGKPMNVLDTKDGQQIFRRPHNYVGLEGAGIEECKDVSMEHRRVTGGIREDDWKP